MTYRIDAEDANSNKHSIFNFTKLVYGGELNGTHYFDILIEDAGSSEFTKFAKGYKIYIYRNDTLEMTGEIMKRNITDSGMMRIQGLGYVEKKLMDANAPSNTWSSTDTSGVLADDATNILSKQPAVSKGTVDDQSINSFRTVLSESCYEAVRRLAEHTDQDFSFDYANDEVDIENHHGSSTSIGTLNEGIDIKHVGVSEDDSKKVKKVTVLGKGPGELSYANQVSGTYSSGWSQGDPEITIPDKSIDNDTEAASRAQLEYNVRSATRYSYNFKVIDVDYSFTLGDVVTINSVSVNAVDTNVRIVSFKRTVTEANETLEFEVRGTGERESAEDRLSNFVSEKRKVNEQITMKQGTDNSGASELGYYSGIYTNNLTGDDSWSTDLTDKSTGNYKYFFHGCFFTISMDLEGPAGGGTSYGQYIIVRIHNTTDNTYYPNESGITLQDARNLPLTTHTHIVTDPQHDHSCSCSATGGCSCTVGNNSTGISVSGGTLKPQKTLTYSLYIHIPYNWTQKTYRLEYKIENETYWDSGGKQEIRYSYHGTRGHEH